jgi:acyl-CoA synthetase (AMP-forming)/AMP-acid ligase II
MFGIMNLATAFAASVEQRPEKIALYWGESEFTYAALFAQSRAVTVELTGKFGVKPGDRVALWLKNRPEFIPAVFGILGAGAVLVPINNFLKPDEVNYILRDGGVDVLITEDDLAAHTPPLLAARPQLNIFKVEEFVALNPSSIFHLRVLKKTWPSSSTRPARQAGQRARCCRTATCCTTSRSAGWCWKREIRIE